MQYFNRIALLGKLNRDIIKYTKYKYINLKR